MTSAHRFLSLPQHDVNENNNNHEVNEGCEGESITKQEKKNIVPHWLFNIAMMDAVAIGHETINSRKTIASNLFR